MLTQEKEPELQNFAREIRIQNHPTDWDSGIWTHLVGSPKLPWGGVVPAIYAALALKGFFPDGVDGNVEPARDKFTQPL